MNELKCPKCGEVFKVDDAPYAAIVAQVRTKEFEKDVKQNAETLEKEKASAIELKVSKLESEKNKEIADLKSRLEAALLSIENEKSNTKNAVTNALSEKEAQIASLTEKINTVEAQTKLNLQTQLQDRDSKITALQNEISLNEKKFELEKQSIETTHKSEMKIKDDEIAYYKDFKAKQSTKMIGESLEVYCHNEFNKIRVTAFPNAYFEKDNDAKSGSKGDFVFREEKDGVELISIMFEMKNEMDTTSTKHKNEDFFEKLDKDRKTKKCEYAVLVSLLEEDNDFYNVGIADVSFRYEKMYVVRPQFFLSMISVLRNAALNSLQYKKQIKEISERNIDITNFETKLFNFKDDFTKNVTVAGKKFNIAIEEIDKSIKSLEKVKEALRLSAKNLNTANGKLDKVTVKSLTYDNPTMKKLFNDSDENTVDATTDGELF